MEQDWALSGPISAACDVLRGNTGVNLVGQVQPNELDLALRTDHDSHYLYDLESPFGGYMGVGWSEELNRD